MKFTIVKGRTFESKFILKATGSVLPMELDPGDTGVFTLYSMGPNPCIAINNKPLVLTDAVNGEFTLYLAESDTINLTGRQGFEEDLYALLPTYKAIVDFVTVEEGAIQTEIQCVYISEIGITCQ